MNLIMQTQPGGTTDIPNWAITAAVAAVMLILGTFITKFMKHSEVTIQGPVEIRVLQENLKETKSAIAERAAELRKMVDAHDMEHKLEIRSLWSKSDSTCKEVYNFGWRIAELEKRLTGRSNGNERRPSS